MLAIIFWLALPAAWTMATPTSSDQARRVAAQWLAEDSQPLTMALGREIANVRTIPASDGQAAYHLVSLKPAGLVVVAGDDLIQPIIAFSGAGALAPNTKNLLEEMAARDLEGRLAHVRAKRQGAAGKAAQPALDETEQAAQARWRALLDGPKPGVAHDVASVSDLRVAPLVQSHWGQTSGVYNYYTPPFEPGNAKNYPSGCVATAMAQLMRYHRYPTAGIGPNTFSITVDSNRVSRSARGGDGNGGPYNWNAMPLVLANMTLPESQAIGALLQDVGAAIGSIYTSGVTVSTLGRAKQALGGVFFYSNAAWANNRTTAIPFSQIQQIIPPNLDAGYPVLMVISGLYHALLCDGYGYQGGPCYFHLNFGWDGTEDAWYQLPQDDNSMWLQGSNLVSELVYNIFPSGTGEIVSGRVTDSVGRPLSGALIAATGGGKTYNAKTNGRGIYALAPVLPETTFTINASFAGMKFTSRTATTGQSSLFGSLSYIGNVWAVNFTSDRRAGAQEWTAYR